MSDHQDTPRVAHGELGADMKGWRIGPSELEPPAPERMDRGPHETPLMACGPEPLSDDELADMAKTGVAGPQTTMRAAYEIMVRREAERHERKP